jgi:hypothetical protein
MFFKRRKTIARSTCKLSLTIAGSRSAVVSGGLFLADLTASSHRFFSKLLPAYEPLQNSNMVNWILGDLFLKDFGHRGSIKKLWEQRWAFPVCTSSATTELGG